ncbi:hypothetical protein OG598_14825 [Micromonospora sp. NBC_00330]|uniref:hypothetical protein n=1 Tax=Micromonospora sp. NBC_00330 TaxID=2903585 RepID=UPI002E2B9625|nr:hypothetical protein [Micromonospora sp. NBC_00330]
MANFDDQMLAGVFAEFRNEVAPYVRSGGAAAAHETVRHRKRVRAIAATALAALFVVAPVTAYAAMSGDSHGPPAQVGESQSPTPGPSTPGPSSPEPTTVAPSGGASPKVPDGRISKAELDDATLDIPAWAPDAYVGGCLSGRMKFTDGAHFIKDSFHVWVEEVVHADVDHDGARETVARLSCGDQVSTFQVVAFDRDAAGVIRTVGQVAVQSGAIKTICDIGVGTRGDIEVEVGDFRTPLRCLERPPAFVQLQRRSYAWNGTRFVQTGGPTEFPVNHKVTDLAITSSDLVFGAPVNGVRHGSMTVTVSNLGPAALPFHVIVSVPAGLQLSRPSACKIETFPQPVVSVTCDQAALAAAARTTVTLEFTAAKPVTPDFLPQAVAKLADRYGDPKLSNDEARFTVKF